MALNFKRGAAAIEEAATRKEGGNFRPFVPELRWQEDGESKHILVLTPIDDVATVLLHEWVPVGKGERADGETYTQFEWFISRKDVAIGEDFDELEDRLEREPKWRCMGVAAELEPVMENVGGRKKVKGFVVKTDTYTRQTDDGEVEVTQPTMGIVTQSAMTLWGTLTSTDRSQGPLAELPIEVIRRGKSTDTRYDAIPFMDLPVDLSPILEYLDGISYLSENLDETIAAIEAEDTQLGQAQVVAEALLNQRLEELCDKERYDELVSDLEPDDVASKFSKKGKGKAKENARRGNRPARQTRRQAREETEKAPAEAEAKPSPSKEDRFAALKARVENSR